MTKNVFRFTNALYVNAQTALINSCNGIDAAIASSENTLNKWGKICAAGLQANSLTLETIKADIIKAYKGADTLADCGSTIKGRFYALQRIANGNALERLVSGESFHTVARDCKSVQKQETGKRAKGGNGKAKATSIKTISLSDASAAFTYWLKTASANTDKAKELASSRFVLDVVEALGALNKAAIDGAAKPAKAKPVKAKRPAKPRAANVAVMKKAA